MLEGEELREAVGELADEASNYEPYGGPMFAALSDQMRMDAMHRGLVSLRDGLVDLLLGLGGERPWWDERESE